ncbi:MAG TPA: large-conductance mechanosensitive channel protein MscL [Gemmataceae bacterium]|nr:large-conductance mechanosensitive channel protein MscL [Gemmataceae bacterium]
MGLLTEFKEFAMRGNVVDMAVGIIIGAAFGKIVSSLVGDVLMPPIGLAVGGVNFTGLQMQIGTGEKGPVYLNYGNFLQTFFDFLIVVFCVFLLVKAMNALKRPAKAAPTTKQCPYCVSTIPIAAVRCAYCTSELK